MWGLRASPLSSFPRLLDLNRNQMSAWCIFLVLSPEFSSPSSSRLKMQKVQHTLPSHLVSFIQHFEVESTQQDVQLCNVALKFPGFAFCQLLLSPISTVARQQTLFYNPSLVSQCQQLGNNSHLSVMRHQGQVSECPTNAELSPKEWGDRWL